MRLVKSYLLAKSLNIEINCDTLLISSGLLDSVEIFSLCLDIEKYFTFKNGQFDFDHNILDLDSVSNICLLLRDS